MTNTRACTHALPPQPTHPTPTHLLAQSLEEGLSPGLQLVLSEILCSRLDVICQLLCPWLQVLLGQLLCQRFQLSSIVPHEGLEVVLRYVLCHWYCLL